MSNNRAHFRRHLCAWRASLLEKQKFLVAAYAEMRRQNDPNLEDQADFMDLVSRVIAMVEDEEWKAAKELADSACSAILSTPTGYSDKRPS